MRQQKKEFEWMLEQISGKLENRRRIRNPFKLNPMAHIYRYALTPQEWKAFHFLARRGRFKSAIWGTTTVNIREIPSDIAIKEFSVSLPSDADDDFEKYPSVTPTWNDLPEQVREYLIAWCEIDYTLKTENGKCYSRLKRIGEDVNTWGQLYRIWPSLIGLFPKDMREKCLRAKARSSLPFDIRDSDDPEAEVAGIRRSVERAEEVFAETLLLPEHEGLWPNVKYPSG